MVGLLERVNFRDRGDPPEADVAASVGELGELDPDPPPGRKTRSRSSTRRGGASSKTTTTAQAKRQISDEIETYAKMTALAWSIRDEHCGAVLNATSKGIADSLASLVIRSDYLVDKFTTGTLFLDIAKFVHEVAPLVGAVWTHHIVRKTVDEPEPVPDGNWHTYAPYTG